MPPLPTYCRPSLRHLPPPLQKSSMRKLYNQRTAAHQLFGKISGRQTKKRFNHNRLRSNASAGHRPSSFRDWSQNQLRKIENTSMGSKRCPSGPKCPPGLQTIREITAMTVRLVRAIAERRTKNGRTLAPTVLTRPNESLRKMSSNVRKIQYHCVLRKTRKVKMMQPRRKSSKSA